MEMKTTLTLALRRELGRRSVHAPCQVKGGSPIGPHDFTLQRGRNVPEWTKAKALLSAR